MKFVIQPSMADAFRRADGTLPDNIEVWDGRTRAVGGPETWLGESTTYDVIKISRVRLPKLPELAERPALVTFKGKRVAQWKQELSPRSA